MQNVELVAGKWLPKTFDPHSLVTSKSGVAKRRIIIKIRGLVIRVWIRGRTKLCNCNYTLIILFGPAF